MTTASRDQTQLMLTRPMPPRRNSRHHDKLIQMWLPPKVPSSEAPVKLPVKVPLLLSPCITNAPSHPICPPTITGHPPLKTHSTTRSKTPSSTTTTAPVPILYHSKASSTPQRLQHPPPTTLAHPTYPPWRGSRPTWPLPQSTLANALTLVYPTSLSPPAKRRVKRRLSNFKSRPTSVAVMCSETQAKIGYKIIGPTRSAALDSFVDLLL